MDGTPIVRGGGSVTGGVTAVDVLEPREASAPTTAPPATAAAIAYHFRLEWAAPPEVAVALRGAAAAPPPTVSPMY
jgi:hypothetical protein